MPDQKTRTIAPLRQSLLARVMLGVFALLAAGGIVVAIASFGYGQQAAKRSFDRLLLGAAQDIAESVKITNGTPIADLPVSAFSLLSLALDDRISYAVRSADGILLTGYETAPLPQIDLAQLSSAHLFDATLQDEGARFVTVARRFAERDYSGTVFVTVGHTLRARNVLALELTKTALLGMGIAGLILMICAFFVVKSALTPLKTMTRNLQSRSPYDLTPMSTNAPSEMAVMIIAMNQFMRRLDRQVTAMRNLISDTAHQLRTPVAAIRAHAELAADETAPQDRQQGLENLLRRTRSLGSLLDQMLSRALVIHRTDNAPPEHVDLRDIALHVIEANDHTLLAPEKAVELLIGDDAVIVLADAVSMREAVKNMLMNALKHGVSPIRIGVTQAGGSAHIWVSDAGPGPSDEVLARIGDRFERFAASKGNSAGLGLSIVNAVAEAFDGTMTMARFETEFRLTMTLPQVDQTHEV